MSPFEIKPRIIKKTFERYFFKPRGVPLVKLELIKLGHDEMEAIRLIDIEKMNQQDAAKFMQVSRSTMQRIIDAAHEKIGQALINGWAIEIEGGNYMVKNESK